MEQTANLYINCRSLEFWRVEHRALTLKLRARAAQIFPLARLARVVFIGALKGDARDLQRLLEHGIGVALLDVDGRLLGAFYGPGEDSLALAEIAERIAWDRSLDSWFAEWLENQQAHVEAEVKKFAVRRPEVPKKQRLDCLAWIQGFARVQFYQLAAQCGLDPVVPCNSRLLERLGAILEPWIRMHVWRMLSKAPAADAAYCVRYFEKIEKELELHQRRLLVQLEMRASRWL